MSYLDEILRKHPIDAASYSALEGFIARDYFKKIEQRDFNKMISFFEEDALFDKMFKHILPILTDGNSNYACVYADGVLKGKVCYLSHSEPSLQPVFRDINSLVAAINSNPDAEDMDSLLEKVSDYPVLDDAKMLAADRAVVEQLYRDFEEEDDEEIKAQIAFSIMALTPPADIERLYEFIESDDMYIQEQAIIVLGEHRYTPAIPKLEELATTAMLNGQTAAKLALKKIRKA